MREINAKQITEVVKKLCIDANFYLGEDVLAAFDRGEKMEESPVGKEIFQQLKENARIAREEQVAICQDTGLAVVFVEMGQEVHVAGGDFNAAVNEGVGRGIKDGYLRKSSCHCFTRANTKDNTPAIIHLEMVPGDKMKITVAPKGGGSENMSTVNMLTPSDGIEGVKNRVVEWVKQAGSNPCPPVVVGVGIGGTFEQARPDRQESPAAPPGAEKSGPAAGGDGRGASHPDQQPGDRAAGAGRKNHGAGGARGDDPLPYRQLSDGREHQLPCPPA